MKRYILVHLQNYPDPRQRKRNPGEARGTPDPDLQPDDTGRDRAQGGHGEDGRDGEPGDRTAPGPGGQGGREGPDVMEQGRKERKEEKEEVSKDLAV